VRSGRKERGLSLFLIDAAREDPGDRASSYFLARELKLLGVPFQYYIPESSPLHSRAGIEELPVETLRVGGERDVLGTWRLARSMKRSACRLVHVHDPSTQPLAAAAAARAKVPLQVVTWADHADLSLPSRQRSFRSVDLVVVRKEVVKDELKDLGIAPEAVKVIPRGRDFSLYTRPEDRGFLRRELGLGPEVRLIGVKTRFSGGRTWLILKRLRQILESDPTPTRVVILGEGDLDIVSRRTVPPEGFLYYLGWHEAFPQVITSLDVLVVLSSDPGDRERLQAAMAAGVPLVAAVKGGLPRELVHQKTGMRFPPDDSSGLVRSFSEILRNRELGTRLGNEGQDAVLSKHSVQAMARRLIKEYERIARRKGISLFQAVRTAETS
jgi:glycosyltransferase involved in cell wall biosynthesis